MNIKQFLLGLVLVTFVYVANAADSTSINPSGISINSMGKVSKLYYLTLASGTFNPITNAGAQKACPNGGVFVNGSAVSVPNFPGVVPGPSGVNMWQCTIVLSFWVTPNNNISMLDTVGIDPNLTNIVAALSINSWQSYGYIANSSYTAYQFTNNAFVPIGIGGSGLGCFDNCGSRRSGGCGTSAVTCYAGGVALPAIHQSGSSTWLYYVQPNTTIQCNLHRNYQGHDPYWPSCDGTTTVVAGNALAAACCGGTWKISTVSFTDPKFNTCLGGCT
jgi:hypothetical protein